MVGSRHLHRVDVVAAAGAVGMDEQVTEQPPGGTVEGGTDDVMAGGLHPRDVEAPL